MEVKKITKGKETSIFKTTAPEIRTKYSETSEQQSKRNKRGILAKFQQGDGSKYAWATKMGLKITKWNKKRFK